jgi:Domain of unknown function (DUF1707)
VTQDTPAIRASDAEREQAVALLQAHAVDGRLTLEEFAVRIDEAYAARTRDELDVLRRDLPETPGSGAAVPKRKATRRLVAVLSGLDRRGRWRLGSDTLAVAFLGGIDLDLRDAEIEAAESQLTLYTVLGGADIKVPEGVDLEVGGFSLLGGKDVRGGTRPLGPGAPKLTIRAFTFLGGVSVTTKPPR